MGKFLKTFASSVSRPKAGATVAWVQWVHLHPSILSNGCIAPVLMKKCHESSSWRVRKGTVLDKNVVYSSIFEIRGCLHYP